MKTFKEVLISNVLKTPEKDAFLIKGADDSLTQISYGTFLKHISATADFLNTRGERYCLMFENNYEWILLHAAIVCSSNTAVPLDIMLPGDTLAELVRRTKSKTVFYSDAFVKKAEQMMPLLPSVVFINVNGAEFQNAYRKPSDVDAFKRQIPDENDCACIIFTSGTTGEQKGVMLSQKNILTGTSVYVFLTFLSADDRMLSFLPFYHSYGYASTYAALSVGAAVCIATDIKRFIGLIRFYIPTVIALFPALVKALIAEVDAKSQTLDEFLEFHIRLIITGGAAFPAELREKVEKYNLPLVNGYGMTECSPTISCNHLSSNDLGTIGIIPPFTTVKIADDGEIMVKGDHVMLGYLDDTAGTSEIIQDGWLYTGDLGYFDEKNRLVYTGRKKNLIVLDNGKNIAPEELETLLASIPEILEVLVYEDDGKLAAKIYTTSDSSLVQEKIAAVNKTLPNYKRLIKIRFQSDPLPKTSTNKIIRR